MDPEAIPNFLAQQRDEAPAEIQHVYLSLEDLWDRKLWHQLTDELLEFFETEESASQRLPIFRTFILSFADKINQLKLVTLALSASTQCKGSDDSSAHTSATFTDIQTQTIQTAVHSSPIFPTESTSLLHKMPTCTPRLSLRAYS